MLNVCEASPDSYVTKYAGVCFPPAEPTKGKQRKMALERRKPAFERRKVPL